MRALCVITTAAMEAKVKGPKKRLFIIIIAVIVLLAAAVGVPLLFSLASGQKWQRYSSASGQFAVLFPGRPAEDSEPQLTPAGLQQYHQVSADQGKREFIVRYADLNVLPSNEEAKKILQVMHGMAETQLQQLTKPALIIKDERSIAIDGFPGFEFKYDDKNTGTTTIRYYLVKNRLYILSATSNNVASQQQVAKFLDSFTFTGDPWTMN